MSLPLRKETRVLNSKTLDLVTPRTLRRQITYLPSFYTSILMVLRKHVPLGQLMIIVW